jgi:hypothetical protein
LMGMNASRRVSSPRGDEAPAKAQQSAMRPGLRCQSGGGAQSEHRCRVSRRLSPARGPPSSSRAGNRRMCNDKENWCKLWRRRMNEVRRPETTTRVCSG